MRLLVIDLSEDFVIYGMNNAGSCLSEIPTDDVWNSLNDADSRVKASIGLDSKDLPKNLAFSIPIKMLSYQIISLPENIPEKEKLILLGLEINERTIGKKFSYIRLPVTQRYEGEEQICDYIVIAAKFSASASLEKLAKTLGYKNYKVVPSFIFSCPKNHNVLSATALLCENKTEIVIWGKDNPLALTSIINTGDQMGDINRFIIEYFDHVDDLGISKVFLYGPRMKDASLTYSLNYPYEIINEPETFIARSLSMVEVLDDISKAPKLPKPPIALTPRNLVFMASIFGIFIIILLGTFFQFNNLRLERDLRIFQNKAQKNKKLSIEKKRLDKEKMELSTEKDFYLSITKRRTPWYFIFSDLSKQTPKELWFERFNANSKEILISGKAASVKDVSAFSVNLDNSSTYFKDSKIIGTRDYEGESKKTYSEFQLTAKLKAPSGVFVAR